MKNINFFKICLPLFIFSLIFHQIGFYEILKNVTIRPSEIIFIFIFIIFILSLIINKITYTFSRFDYLLILFPILNFIHCLIFNDSSSVVGLTFSIYCFLIYFIFKTYFLNFGINWINKIFIFSGILTSFIAILGWLLIQFKVETTLVLTYEYPLSLGEPGRSRALFDTPNSLFIFLVFPILLLMNEFKEKKNIKSLILFLFTLFGALVTLSKSYVLLLSLIIIFTIYYLNLKKFKIFFIFFSVSLILIYVFFSHLILLNKNSEKYENYTTTAFVSKNFEPVFEYENLVLIPTNYVETKKKNLELFKKNPLFGNGFNSYQKYKSKNVPHETGKPHSTFFGYLSEFGLIGFFLIALTFAYSTLINWSNRFDRYYLFLFSIYILFESLNADLMTSRIIWIFFAYSEFTSINNRNNEAKKVYTFR